MDGSARQSGAGALVIFAAHTSGHDQLAFVGEQRTLSHALSYEQARGVWIVSLELPQPGLQLLHLVRGRSGLLGVARLAGCDGDRGGEDESESKHERALGGPRNHGVNA